MPLKIQITKGFAFRKLNFSGRKLPLSASALFHRTIGIARCQVQGVVDQS